MRLNTSKLLKQHLNTIDYFKNNNTGDFYKLRGVILFIFVALVCTLGLVGYSE